MKGQTWRLVLTIGLIVLAFIGFWNTLRYWTLTEADKERMEVQKPGSVQELQRKAMRLGLDLQGGVHIILRVQLEKIEPSARGDAVDRAIQIIRNRVDFIGVAEPVIQRQGDDRIIVDLPGYTDAARAEELIGQTAQLEFKLLETQDNANLILQRIDSVMAEINKQEKAPSSDEPKAVETERAASDTATADTAAKDIFADILGADTLDMAEGDRPFTLYLDPFLYNTSNNTQWPGYVVAARDRRSVEKMLERPEVKRVIPEDVQFAWSTRPEIVAAQEVYKLYILKSRVQFLGKHLERIKLGKGQYQENTVDFRLSGEASAAFARLTGANIDKPLAIVIDNKVESAPFINSRIRNEGQITMGSSATIKDAQNLEVVLKAGALPAPMEIIAKNVVGATLGSDTIKKGFYSAIVGLFLVLAYIAFYYRLSGLIADIGLIFNLFFLLSVMAALEATLTMPGIAGIILTIGMSVDANILIFERIREELRSGKTVRASIDAGYHRAWAAILDGHVTTLITAAALYIIGAGSIRGFAVSLFWGVLISLFTAYVITKLIFDMRKHKQSLSI